MKRLSLYFNNDLGDPKGDYGPAHSDAYKPGLIAELLSATNELIAAYK